MATIRSPDPDRVNVIIPNSGQEGCCVFIRYGLLTKVGQTYIVHGSTQKQYMKVSVSDKS